MALIIENGTQVADANSYTTEVDAATVAESYGLTIEPATAESNLKTAYKWLNTLEREFQGMRLSDISPATEQTGVWPRKPVYIRGNLQDANSIPVELIEAQVLAAIANESSSILLPTIATTSGGIKREELEGVGSQEFFQGASRNSNETNAALLLAKETLYPLLEKALGYSGAGLSIRKHYS